MKGDPLVQSKNLQKSLIVPKKNEPKGFGCCRGSGRWFCFFLFVRGSEVSSVLNLRSSKKGPYASQKKRPTVRVGHFSSKAPTKTVIVV